MAFGALIPKARHKGCGPGSLSSATSWRAISLGRTAAEPTGTHFK